MQAALRLPLRYAISVCAGIAAANGVYLIVAVLELEAVREVPALMQILKFLGGGYLICIGIMLLRAPRRTINAGNPVTALHAPGMRRQFAVGFLSAIFNPKNAIFYLSLFMVMVAVETPLVVRVLYAFWMVGIVFVWDMGVALAFGNERVQKIPGQWVFRIEKFSGVVLAVFGFMLAVG